MSLMSGCRMIHGFLHRAEVEDVFDVVGFEGGDVRA